jgi:SAM-dependent methyltransferase
VGGPQSEGAGLTGFPAPCCAWPQQQPAAAGQADTSSSVAMQNIRAAVRAKYDMVAVSVAGRFTYPTGREGAEKLGYDPALIARAHPDLLGSFCGVGNPFSLGDLLPGQRILDFGCGAGFDLFVASQLVGPGGTVYGIDLTAKMAQRATENLARAGITNCVIRQVDTDIIPWRDDFFDIVISNGVINLCPDKRQCLDEIFRVIKPGGEIRFADVILEQELPAHLTGSAEAWAH